MTAEPDHVQDHVGELVRRWRERRRLSQQALSDRCGVSTRHLSYIETGKSVPSPTMIGQLGSALDVPLMVQRRMSFLTTTTVFGTPRDVTVAELAIEALYPADATTRDLLVAHG